MPPTPRHSLCIRLLGSGGVGVGGLGVICSAMIEQYKRDRFSGPRFDGVLRGQETLTCIFTKSLPFLSRPADDRMTCKLSIDLQLC